MGLGKTLFSFLPGMNLFSSASFPAISQMSSVITKAKDLTSIYNGHGPRGKIGSYGSLGNMSLSLAKKPNLKAFSAIDFDGTFDTNLKIQRTKQNFLRGC